MNYAELCVMSNFTFLTGASHPEELIMRAAASGLEAIAITDRNSLAGVVRAYTALKELRQAQTDAKLTIRSRQLMDHSSRQPVPHATGETPLPAFEKLPKLIVGSRLVLTDSKVEWIALPMDRTAYGRLTRLLSVGKQRAAKGQCQLTMDDLLQWAEGMILIALPDNPTQDRELARVARRFPGNVFLGMAPRYDGEDVERFAKLASLGHRCGMPSVAVGDVLMHHASRRAVADVLTCLRIGCTIDTLGLNRLPNAERRIRSPAEMAYVFRDHPAALRRTLEIATRCNFDLSELKHDYPDECVNGEPAQDRLARLAHEGLAWRYPEGAPAGLDARVTKELDLIAHMEYAPYFLTVHDIVKYARSKDILCQGRGSAANSVICYLLGITEVPPGSITMIFERFISRERGEPPDIDVDFEHERREEVIQWIYERYGRHRAGLTATVIHFRSRAAIREVGKVMGLSGDTIAALSGQIWGWSSAAPDTQRVQEAGLNLADRRVALTMKLIAEIIGFPRHLSQHVGGFVITQGRLDELCPIENAAMDNRTIIEWDKDDIDALGLLKVDVHLCRPCPIR